MADSNASSLPDFLTVDETAEFLRVNRKTVYASIQRDEFPGVVRIGKVIRISKDAVVSWLTEGQG